MILLSRLLVALITPLLALALALAGLAVAIASIGTGDNLPSLTGFADVAGLGSLETTVGSWLAQLQAPGSVALLSALGGLAAIFVGLGLIAGVVVPRRERLVKLATNEHGSLAARRRPLANVAAALAEQVRGVTEARAKVRPKRTSGGRLTVRASRPRPATDADVTLAVNESLTDLTGPFDLTTKVSIDHDGARVQ